MNSIYSGMTPDDGKFRQAAKTYEFEMSCMKIIEHISDLQESEHMPQFSIHATYMPVDQSVIFINKWLSLQFGDMADDFVKT